MNRPEIRITLLSLDEIKEKPGLPGIATHGLLITLLLLDPGEISPTFIKSALHHTCPKQHVVFIFAEFRLNTRPPQTRRGAYISSASRRTEEELPSQLEIMAQQLKQNAMHFSTSLEKDKAVVKDAQLKLEGNYGTMQKERVRGKDSSTIFMVVSIFNLVPVLVFMLMVFSSYSPQLPCQRALPIPDDDETNLLTAHTIYLVQEKQVARFRRPLCPPGMAS